MALCEKNGLIFFDSELVSSISSGDNEKARSLLEGIEKPRDLRNSAGQTLLHIAARYGNIAMTKQLIEEGFEVDARNKFGCTPLALAVQHCHLETIRVLLQANADIYDSEHRECLLQRVFGTYMSRRKSMQVHKRILDMFSIRVRAGLKRDRKITGKILFASKCSLHVAVMLLRSVRLTKYYLKNGVDVNVPEAHSGCTALHVAVAGTDIDLVRFLVENGADVNALDRCKRTPLFYYNCSSSDSYVKVAMLDYLIDHGASLDVTSDDGITLIGYLLSNGGSPTVDAVLKRNIDLSAVDSRFNRMPIHYLASNTASEAMEWMKFERFEVDARDLNGDTPLMIAVLTNRNFDTIEFLLDCGADINVQNNQAHTPLYHAVNGTLKTVKRYEVRVKICELLLKRGANIQYTFKTYRKKKEVLDEHTTFFDILVKNNKYDISKLLLAQLAINHVQGEPIQEVVRAKIEANDVLKEQFNVCQEQIEKMKVARINESLTLFDIITGKDEDLVAHMIDFEVVSKLEELMNNFLEENSYYVDTINKRVAKLVNKMKLTKELKAVITEPTCCIS